jgi:hypothetical protein
MYYKHWPVALYKTKYFILLIIKTSLWGAAVARGEKWENKWNREDPGSLPTPGNLFKKLAYCALWNKIFFFYWIKTRLGTAPVNAAVVVFFSGLRQGIPDRTNNNRFCNTFTKMESVTLLTSDIYRYFLSLKRWSVSSASVLNTRWEKSGHALKICKFTSNFLNKNFDFVYL